MPSPHWLTVARYRQRGLPAATPTLFALAWQDPPRLPSVLDDLDDELLDRAFQSFERASEWAEIDAAGLPAWFPAWYVLEHPAAAKELEGIGNVDGTPAAAAQLLARIDKLERQAD